MIGRHADIYQCRSHFRNGILHMDEVTLASLVDVSSIEWARLLDCILKPFTKY